MVTSKVQPVFCSAWVGKSDKALREMEGEKEDRNFCGVILPASSVGSRETSVYTVASSRDLLPPTEPHPHRNSTNTTSGPFHLPRQYQQGEGPKMPFYRMMCIAAHYPEYVCTPRGFFFLPRGKGDRVVTLTTWLGKTETHKGPRYAVCYARFG